MIYTNRNNAVENKIVTCFPVLVVKFNKYKSVLMDNKYYTFPNNIRAKIAERDEKNSDF